MTEYERERDRAAEILEDREIVGEREIERDSGTEKETHTHN